MSQHKFHMDGVARIDANLNAFFSRQLEQIRPQLFEIKYPELKARKWIPIKNDINPGAEVYTYQTLDQTGKAAPITDYGKDMPRVDVAGAAEDSQKMRAMGASYGWNIQEARAAMFAGLDLDTRKARAARRAIEHELNEILLIGSTRYGITLRGLFNVNSPTTYTVVNTTWADETPDEIIADMTGIVSKVKQDSKEIEFVDTLLLPLTSLELIKNRRMGDGSNVTILSYFLELMRSEVPGFLVDSSQHLEADGGHSGGSVKRMVAYRRDPEVLEGIVQEFEQFPPEFKSLEVVTQCMARTGGVVAYRNKAVAYGDNI